MKFENIFKNKIIVAAIGLLTLLLAIFFMARGGYVKTFTNLPLEGDYSNIVIGPKQVFILKDGYIGSFSKDGKEIKRINLPLKGGNIVGDKDFIVFYSNSNIYLLDKSGKIKASQKLNFPIEDCVIKNNRALAVGKNSYAVIDSSENIICKGKVNGRIITYDLGDEKAIITSIVKKDEEENNVISFMYSVDLNDKKETVVTFPNELIFYSEAFQDGHVLTVSNIEARVMKDEVILGKKKINDFKSARAYKNNIFILEDDKLGVYDLNLINQKKMELKGDFSSLAILKDKVYLYNSKGFAMYENGMVKDFVQTEEVQDVIVNSSDIFFIHSNSISVEN